MNNLVQTTARMNSIALRPFRKIKVRDHLGPGYKPNVLHCLQASRIVADEISVRLARRIHEINCVPKNFAELPYAKQVSTWYTQTCQELFEFTDEVEHLRVHPDHQTDYWPPPKRSFFSFFKSSKPDPIDIQSQPLQSPDQDLDKIVFGTECTDPILAPRASQITDKLFHILERAVARHKPISLLATQALYRSSLDNTLTPEELQIFLTKFHYQRIAVRLLIGHCVALYKPLPMENMIGIFCTKTPIEDIVLESVQLAEELAMITYGCVPPVELSCSTETGGDLLYIPSHLQHIIFELIKNSMRAVLEKEQARIGADKIISTATLPPITVHWDLTPDHCLFEIRDQGLGIHPEQLKNCFLFHYSTAPKPKNDEVVMAGYGYGLSLSRLYARFLKGDIWIESEYGVGTSVFIKLKANWDPDELI